MSETAVLSVWTNGTETVIAASEEDAQRVWEEWMGAPRHEEGEYSWERWSDETPLTLVSVDEADSEEETLTASEWAAREGRGFLFSTEL